MHTYSILSMFALLQSTVRSSSTVSVTNHMTVSFPMWSLSKAKRQYSFRAILTIAHKLLTVKKTNIEQHPKEW